MIEIRNTGKKLVHIGKKPLMPGEYVQVSDKLAVTPAIKVFAKRGIISLTDVKETTAAKAVEAVKVKETTKAEKTVTSTAKAEETTDDSTMKDATATTKKTTSVATKTAK